MPLLPTNLADWLAYIDTGHSAAIDLGLERIRPVAEKLALAGTWSVPVITIAGTNGKGSTQALIASVARAHGLKVGCYSSPHFLRYNERVQIDREPVTDTALCHAFSAVEHARKTCDVSLTYFEYGTLAALWLFRRQPLDLIILEVGLGGRLDAVNLVDPTVAVVTTVALDHEAWLGSEREQIGYEKVGIARSGVPLIFGEPDLPNSVAEYCQTIKARLLCWGEAFGPTTAADCRMWSWWGQGTAGEALHFDQLPPLNLPFANASTALQALASLGIKLDGTAIRQGLANAKLTGRMQRVYWQNRTLILDVAHNPHAAIHLAAQLAQEEGGVVAVIAMLSDKDQASTLAALSPAVSRWIFAGLTGERGCSAQQLASAAASVGIEGDCRETVTDALQFALSAGEAGDKILVCGSFFTVAEALAQLEQTR